MFDKSFKINRTDKTENNAWSHMAAKAQPTKPTLAATSPMPPLYATLKDTILKEMKLDKLTPMLYTTDLKETVDFYVQTLGFKCKSFEIEWGWASVFIDNIEIMFSLPNDHIPFDKPTFTGSFYFKTEQVDELWNNIKDKSNVAYPVENFDYGMREFAIHDNNGYLLQFGQEINETKK